MLVTFERFSCGLKSTRIGFDNYRVAIYTPKITSNFSDTVCIENFVLTKTEMAVSGHQI